MNIPSILFEAERGRKPQDLPKAITDYLTFKAMGHEHPVTEKQMDYDLTLKKGVARAIIRRLRKKGSLIASGLRGYWILGPMPSWEDIKAFMGCIGSLRRRAVEIIEVTKPMGRELDRQFGWQIRSHSAQTELTPEDEERYKIHCNGVRE